MDESVSLRPAVDTDLDAIADLVGFVFHDPANEELHALEKAITEVSRSLVADDDGLVVAHATAQTRDMTVPGAIIAAAHVTGVGVAPTHRRRGILTAMMRRQLSEIAAAGREPIAVLWASETKIYPRFGYGLANLRLRFDVMTREVRLTPPGPPSARLRVSAPMAALDDLKRVHESQRAERVGWSSRPEYWWRYLLADPESRRDGATETHAVIADGPDGPIGYALWRVVERWNNHGPNGEVQVREVVAPDPETYAQLWGFLLGIDLTRSASYGMAALDEPLQYMVDEPRRLGIGVGDGLYLRIVDLPAALEARQYATGLDVVVEVTDPLIEANNGRWRLTGGPAKATCTRTEDPPDFACSITELGAVYLGGTSLAGLAAAGRVRQFTGNLPSVAFGWHRQPNPIEGF
ncbi:GNAT family N-acetyltransferase [Actinoplanes sp. TBRC 11911]|uniref:GNAT family N-acetyltransferase n=1 Tax=Actinoplanes sp. TBRC 11911 TaxID=2729386 RepID=UPI00145D87EA|nr:GNAT family N-acetyltransferase [Actinoplanes sp. TBRC 11911]NMO55641.1 GNAT family N-acetyltransferase [Actinoplanes sp. TBRC 11911]